jgi:hypothetical protein
MAQSEDTPLRIHYTDRQGVPVAIDITGKKIFIINCLDNKEGRSFFREVFIRRGAHSGVYGVEESPEC